MGREIPELKVETGGSKRVLLIIQIESTVELDEVKYGILKLLGEEQKDLDKTLEVKITETRWGSKSAEVVMNKAAGEIIANLGKVKLGWSICPIKEKKRIIRCYGCLKIGHSHFEYRSKGNDDKTIRCFKCTEEGHIAANCTGQANCKNCNKIGHRADSGNCPRFRNSINKQ